MNMPFDTSVYMLLGVRLFSDTNYTLPHTTQKELDLPSGQILGLFNRLTHKFVQLFKSLQESAVDIATPTATPSLQPLKKTIDEELVSNIKQ